MVQIIISLFLGLTLLISTAIIFYRWAGRPVYILALIALVSPLNIYSGNEYLHVFSSIIIAGATAGYSFRSGRSFQFYLLLSSLVLTVILSSNYYFLKNYKNIDVFSKSRETIVEIINGSKNFSDANKKEILSKLDDSLSTIKDIAPFSFFLNSILICLFCFYFLKLFFIRQYSEKSGKIEGIEKFRLKDYLIFILIGGWLAVLLLDSAGYYLLYVTGLNAALIMSFFYVIQSFGIIKFFLMKKGLPVQILPVVIIIVLFIGFEYIVFLLVILSSFGAFDFWADFRRLNAPKEKD